MLIRWLKSHSGEIDIYFMRDGSIRGVGVDLGEAYSYDLSMEEFGEGSTEFSEFMKAWSQNRLAAMSLHYPLPNEEAVLLAADFTEHVLPIFMKTSSESDVVSESIKLVHKKTDGDVDNVKIQNHIQLIHTWIDLNSKILPAVAVANAAMQSLHLAKRLNGQRSTVMTILLNVEHYAQVAVQLDSGELVDTPEWKSVGEKEMDWQIRRFVHAMDSKVWPLVSETE